MLVCDDCFTSTFHIIIIQIAIFSELCGNFIGAIVGKK